MSGYVYHVEIVNLSGTILASFQAHGDDTMRNVLLRDQPESELCIDTEYTFVYVHLRCVSLML